MLNCTAKLLHSVGIEFCEKYQVSVNRNCIWEFSFLLSYDAQGVYVEQFLEVLFLTKFEIDKSDKSNA